MSISVDFFEQLILTGALTPSSPALVAATTQAIDRHAGTILELGPGNGAISSDLIRRFPGARLLAIERNWKWVEHMRRTYPQFQTVHGDAADAPAHLESFGLTSVDAVVASLPWSLMESAKQRAILDATWKILRGGGQWVSFIYLSGTLLPGGFEFLHRIHNLSRRLKRRIVFKSLPPALSICCTR